MTHWLFTFVFLIVWSSSGLAQKVTQAYQPPGPYAARKNLVFCCRALPQKIHFCKDILGDRQAHKICIPCSYRLEMGPDPIRKYFRPAVNKRSKMRFFDPRGKILENFEFIGGNFPNPEVADLPEQQ